jgi:Zn-dependent M28 family amino/carboxypeptidase
MRLQISVPLASILAAVVACRPAIPAIGAASAASTSSLAADIDTLTSSAFGGREAGTTGADSAADFVARRYQHLGLRGAFHSDCDSAGHCQPSYFGPFELRTGFGRNVGALIPGTGPTGTGEFVVIGAHFDGLGHSPTWALDRDAGFVMRPGADDNASGTAAVLELAQRLRERATKRSILLYNFDAEEEGRVGSRALLSIDPLVARDAMVFMINLDMVGRLNHDRLYIEGGATDPRIRAIFDSAAAATHLRVQFIPRDGLSDDASFVEAGIDAAYLSTGRHADYHTARDIASRLNIDGLRRLADFTELVVRGIADR